MSKQPSTPPNMIRVDDLDGIKQDIVFMPSPVHRRAKSKFWTRFDGLSDSPETVTMLQAQRLTQEPGIAKWWGVPGFKEWFLNYDEARERLEYLFMIALDAAEGVLLDPDAQASAKVNMVKVIANLAGKEPSKDNQQYLDTQIQRMNPEQLKAFIAKKAPRLVSGGETTVDVEVEEE